MAKLEQVLIIDPPNELTFVGKISVIFNRNHSILLGKKYVFTCFTRKHSQLVVI